MPETCRTHGEGSEAAGAYRVCLVVIARDGARTLPRLLDSVRPWVDRMLVVDTGSTDGTPAVAKAHGADVEHFDWCDDFSAARNAALDLASSDWHLVLDADEWLISGGACLAGLRATPPAHVGVLQFEDIFGSAPDQRACHWISRLLPGSVRYAGQVHEQPVHQLRAMRLPVLIGHDGYAPAALQSKRGRNRQLLQQSLLRDPGDAYLQYQMGKDLAVYGEHEPAIDHFARAGELAPASAPWLADLMTRMLHSMKSAGRHEDGLRRLLAELESRADSPCADSPDVFFALGDLLLDWAASDPGLAAVRLDQAEAAWLRCLEIGERPDISGSVPGRGGRLAAFNLALIYEGSGRAAEALRLREAHGLETRELLRPG